jgi:hypothetical protein
VFEYLAALSKRIVVTGPQRSGTRIATRMIAMDTGYRYVDEGEFLVHNDELWRLILAGEGIVVQSPGMLKDVVDNPPPGIFVVLMRRSLDDIHASADRIRWEEHLKGNTSELAKFGLASGDSASVKYDYWGKRSKSFPYQELDYESLRGHRLWVEKEHRRNFGPLQTQV